MNRILRIEMKSKYGKYRQVILLFLAGCAIGIWGLCRSQDNVLGETGLLGTYALGPIRYLSLDSGMLFRYVCLRRLTVVLLLLVCSTTYLGAVVNYVYWFWQGLMTGTLLTAAVLRYGFKGVGLYAGCIFPHQLCYVPAFLWLTLEGIKLSKYLYFRREKYQKLNEKELVVKIFLLMAAIGGVIIGCILECYVNPILLKWITSGIL